MRTVKRLNQFPIFDALSDVDCKRLLADRRVEKRIVEAPERIDGRRVYCILSGTAAVYSPGKGHPLLLRYLTAGDIFGVAMLYSAKEPISYIEAKNRLSLIAFPEDVIRELLRSNEQFLVAYLAFLSNRIAFLNGKLSYVAAGSAEQKLAAWLCQVGSDDFDLPVNLSDLARLLDLGRASLYRAFDRLTDRGLIQRSENHIVLLDRLMIQKFLQEGKSEAPIDSV